MAGLSWLRQVRSPGALKYLEPSSKYGEEGDWKFSLHAEFKQIKES